jgi:hypothetical protein
MRIFPSSFFTLFAFAVEFPIFVDHVSGLLVNSSVSDRKVSVVILNSELLINRKGAEGEKGYMKHYFLLLLQRPSCYWAT